MLSYQESVPLFAFMIGITSILQDVLAQWVGLTAFTAPTRGINELIIPPKQNHERDDDQEDGGM
jgi:hypothetical protein